MHGLRRHQGMQTKIEEMEQKQKKLVVPKDEYASLQIQEINVS